MFRDHEDGGLFIFRHAFRKIIDHSKLKCANNKRAAFFALLSMLPKRRTALVLTLVPITKNIVNQPYNSKANSSNRKEAAVAAATS